jgi:hypothetical protein
MKNINLMQNISTIAMRKFSIVRLAPTAKDANSTVKIKSFSSDENFK